MRRILLIMFVATSVFAGTADRRPVMSDNTNIWVETGGLTNQLMGNIIADYFAPSYFCLSEAGDPLILSSSYTNIGGGLVSGTITNTWTRDGTYLIFNESSRPDIRFTHTNITDELVEALWSGYYDGNPAHSWDFYMWNFTASTFDLIAADVLDDFSGDSYSITIPLPEPQTNYASGGMATSRWYHSASIVGANTIGFDYTAILQSQVTIPTAGVFVVATDLASCSVPPVNFNIGGSVGKVTNVNAGVYDISLGGSGTGSTNTIFTAGVFTNGVISTAVFKRKINADGDVGNAWGHALMDLPAGTVLDARLTGDRDNTHLSFFDFKFKGVKIGN